MPVLQLNISSSEQPSSPPLWSESGCHTFSLPATQPRCAFITYSVRARTLTCVPTHLQGLHTQSRTKKNTNGEAAFIKRASIHRLCWASVLHFCPSVFQMLQKKERLDCKIKLVFIKQPTILNSFLQAIPLQQKEEQSSFPWYHAAKDSNCHSVTAASVDTHTHTKMPTC